MKKRNLVLSVMTTCLVSCFYYRDVMDKNKLIVKQ